MLFNESLLCKIFGTHAASDTRAQNVWMKNCAEIKEICRILLDIP